MLSTQEAFSVIDQIRAYRRENTASTLWCDGLAIHGGSVNHAQDAVAGWLREIGITGKP